jgi:ubiquinone biosynthesis protein Coq4
MQATFETQRAIRIQRFFQNLDQLSDRLGMSVPPIVDLEELRSLPTGTLGRAWADSLDRHHLTPLTTGPRRKQLHDGVHVLTGYGVDLIGEAEVQAFLLGTKKQLTHLVLLIGLLSGIRQQRRHGQLNLSTHTIRSRLRQAYQRGQRSQFDVDTWQPERLWNCPLEQVQTMFDINS